MRQGIHMHWAYGIWPGWLIAHHLKVESMTKSLSIATLVTNSKAAAASS
jgi:hypothetical protein